MWAPGPFLPRRWPAIVLALVFLPGCSLESGPKDRSAPEDWNPAPGLKTAWAAGVRPESPLPDYPRPQMVRDEWVILNGIWELAVLEDSAGTPQNYPDRILVPFPLESALSGVARAVSPSERIWYRRTFSLPDTVPASSETRRSIRWLLHFGAVDWEAEVSVNGQILGVHRGGYDPFTLDVTDALREGGDQEVVVAVRDPTDEGDQPRGKQVLDPHGIWYTAVSGIWQSVWLEPVPQTHVRGLRVEPDLQGERVVVTVDVEDGDGGGGVRVVVLDGDREIARATGTAGEPIPLAIPNPRPWSPDDPFLYSLRVSLEPSSAREDASLPKREGSGTATRVAEADEIRSYFGMRSIGIGPDGQGHLRLLLNGEPLFQMGLLDQGWWPDGLYTAPTDQALRSDILRSKALGFNLIRKHVKVEPARWYYHADREGILVWQDMPSADNGTEAARRQFADELRRVVDAFRNHPSIVMWVPFNEGWGQHDTEAVAGWVRAHDSTRLVNAASGWSDEGGGDVLDVHRYPGPGAPDAGALHRWAPPPRRYPDGLPSFPDVRVAVLGEFGGLGIPLAGHTWVEEENWGYRSFETLEALNRAYRDLLLQLRPLIGEGLSAAVYTQTTDVEVEVNGVMTYDREVVKLSEESVAMNRAVYGPPPLLREVVPTSREHPQMWRTSEDRPGGGWADPGYDDSAWRAAPGGFGTNQTPGAMVGTEWRSSELWLRRSFRLGGADLQRLQAVPLYLRIHHDEDAEVYLNGVPVVTLPGYTTGYRLEALSPEAVRALRDGLNVLAVHVSQTDGGQFIDVGIVEWIEGRP